MDERRVEPPRARVVDPARATRSSLHFFVLTYALTGVLLSPSVLAHHGLLGGRPGPFALLVALGFLAPTLAAVILSAVESGGEGARALFRQRPPEFAALPAR
jgi:hypothetical protein